MYSYGPPHKQDDQLEHTYSSYVRILDGAQKTCQRRWTIGKSSERGSGISVLAARHDDDDDDWYAVMSIWPIDRTLSGATTPGQIGPGSNWNKGVLCIPLSSSISVASPSNCLVSYPGHLMGESYPSAEMQSVDFATPVNWVTYLWLLIICLEIRKLCLLYIHIYIFV